MRWFMYIILFVFVCGALVQSVDFLCQKICRRKLTESEKRKLVGLALVVTLLSILAYLVLHQPKEHNGFLIVFEASIFSNGSIFISLAPFGMCAACLWLYYKPQKPEENSNSKTSRKDPKPLLWAAFVLGMVGILTVAVDISEWLRCRDAQKNRTGMVAEGRVCVLDQQPWSGHHPGDLILIDGKQFRVNSFICSHGYAKSIAHGGVLKDGVWARIHYVPNKRYIGRSSGNVIDAVIYRIEINPRK